MSEQRCKHGLPRSECAQCFDEFSILVDALSLNLFSPETVESAAKKGIRNPSEPKEPYMSGYRAGWNDALKALSTSAAGACATALVDAANSMVKV